MDQRSGDSNHDGSSIKPVSSLRSHFENMLSKQQPSTPTPARERQPSRPDIRNVFDRADEVPSRVDGRMSLDIPRTSYSSFRSSSPNTPQIEARTPQSREPTTPRSNQNKPRPLSLIQISPPRSPTRSPPRSPPLVTVHAPRSPPKFPESQLNSPTPSQDNSQQPQTSQSSRSASPQGNGTIRHWRGQSRATTPAIEALQAPFLQATGKSSPTIDPQKPSPSPSEREFGARTPSLASSAGLPPPINRAGKPKIPSKPSSVAGSAAGSVAGSASNGNVKASLAPSEGHVSAEERLSPFSTPPSSDESGFPSPSPPKQGHIKAKLSTSVPGAKQESYFQTAPVRTRPPPDQEHRAIPNRPSVKSLRSTYPDEASDSQEDRPGLPPRGPPRDIRRSKPPPPEPPPARRSTDTSRATVVDPPRSTPRIMPTKRTSTLESAQSASTLSNGVASPSTANPRTRPISSTLTQHRYSAMYADDSDEVEQAADRPVPTLTDYPDSSQANRRPPVFRKHPREISIGYDTKMFSVCGEVLCTSGYLTRAWNLVTGEMVLNTALGENAKVTAMCFRPSKDTDQEGNRIWLGNERGELVELDIATGSIVAEKRSAHPSRIIKIYRYASEMWTIDEDGKINIWPPDETGSPTLSQTPNGFRLPRNHTTSIVAGNKLWVATSKEIRIFQRDSDHNGFIQVLPQALSALGTGEVTSAAMISSQPDRIYFGHNDGKVSVYSRKDYSCLGIFSVSLYKISCLVGAGDYLWAGYNTGMIYVYDTSCTPWKVKKDWHAHENPIAGIMVDRTSLWKMDRLQVASLGTDSVVRIWDGLLKDDWLELDLQDHDAEYCEFREISATVMTWNAGASKPTSLRHDQQDANFFRELLRPEDPPDIMVFGFQELVDLEDKKVTAKSFFKSSKKKDASDQENMSRQYRAWRDHLMRMLEEYHPATRYTLLHTANLVGLFTCLFVKESVRARIRDIDAAEVKLGMGGLHGNKGALIVRFILDDSSLCFINCHLAAGQTQTVHRNNDIAAIMETSALPPQMDPSVRADMFVGGGDGSMVLDHEICILNGDLNYRIDTMTRDAVVRCVKENNLTRLLERDQLLLSRRKNPGFRLRAFREQPITFAPTYKYDVGTDTYDTSEKKRSPAWCDRLLYRGMGRIKQLDYRRHEVRVSDHRPVSGRFKMRVKTINPKRRLVVAADSEGRFEDMKQRVAMDIKLDYLINVFGLSNKDARKLMKLP